MPTYHNLAEKIFTWDCFVGKFTSTTIQQVIKTTTDFLIISTLYGVIMWDIPSGTQVILEDHISLPKARHGRRANKIAQFADGKLIFSTLELEPGTINKLFLYDFW